MNRDTQGRFARSKRIIRSLLTKALVLTIFALVAIVAWERVDDRIEKKWHDLTVTEYVAPKPQKVTSDEEKLIEKYRESEEAKKLIDAWAKGKAAEDMRERAEELAEDARAVSVGFTSAREQ